MGTKNAVTIKDTVKAIKNKKISIVDLVKKHLELAKRNETKINAFISILENEAILQAEMLQKQIEKDPQSLKNKRLLGIPFTAKDLYLVKGIRTTFGSKLMEDFIAPYTGTVIQKILDEGAILIGKCNCDPWGFGASGENSGFGSTKNPYDLDRSPGGSSSGSAASLALGVGFFSLGTDTGGSVRQPAAMCGLFGYKPTYGRNSRYGIGVMGSSFDTPGFFARHVEDIKLLEEIIQGKDRFDSTTDDYKLYNKKLKREFIFGVPKEFFEEGIDAEIRESIDNKIIKLKESGHAVEEVSIPSLKYSLPVYYILVPAEISANRARYDGVRFGKKISDNYEENLVKSRSKFFEDEVKRRIMIGTYVLSSGYSDQFYKKASKVRTKLKSEFENIFNSVDILITPTTPTTAFKLGEKEDPIQMYLSDIFTVTANIIGIPALNIPIGKDSNNLPIGMQLMTDKWRDFDLFNNALLKNLLASQKLINTA